MKNICMMSSNLSMYKWKHWLVETSNFYVFLLGVGRTAPDMGATVTLDGVDVPLGKGVNTNIDDTSLLYNEYPLTLISWSMNVMMILSIEVGRMLVCESLEWRKQKTYVMGGG